MVLHSTFPFECFFLFVTCQSDCTAEPPAFQQASSVTAEIQKFCDSSYSLTADSPLCSQVNLFKRVTPAYCSWGFDSKTDNQAGGKARSFSNSAVNKYFIVTALTPCPCLGNMLYYYKSAAIHRKLIRKTPLLIDLPVLWVRLLNMITFSCC